MSADLKGTSAGELFVLRNSAVIGTMMIFPDIIRTAQSVIKQDIPE